MPKKMKWFVACFAGALLAALLATRAYASEDFTIKKIEQIGANYVSIEWNEYANADGYSLYRCEDNKSFSLVKNVVSCSTNNYGLENGKNYSYKVCPYRVLANGSKQYLAESKITSIQIGVKKPSNLIVSEYGKTSVEIKWSGDPLADYYLLYRSTDNSKWILVKRVYGDNTTTYGLDEGETYYFKVRAARSINGIVRYSEFSDFKECTLGIAAPTYLSVKSINHNTLDLEWESVQDASGYRIYRSENDGEYGLVKSVIGTTTRNYNLSSDVTYTYRIAAIKEENTYTYKSKYTYSDPIRLSLNPIENLHIEEYYNTGVRLGWDSVEGATGYRIYRTGEDGLNRLVKTVSENKTDTYSLVSGQCYSFSVKPICKSGKVTVNGSVSDDVRIFFTSPPTLTIMQREANKIQINWSSVKGADKYRLSTAQVGDDETVEELTKTETEYVVDNPGELYISLCAVKNDVESAEVNAIVTPLYEEKLSFAIAKAINETQISLAWEPVDNATQYEVQRFDSNENEFVTVNVCADANFVDATVQSGTTYQYRYRVKYVNSDNAFWGDWSETVSVTTPSAPHYRALLIGEENYEMVLNGPVNDTEAMNNMLSGMKAMDWEIYHQTDSTRNEIVSLFTLAFDEATENDVSLFYYSGHGVTGSGDYYSGALMTVDYQYIPMQELAELLAAVPGKVIVILDSCGSGAAISGEQDSPLAYSVEDTSVFDPVTFNTQVVQAFSQYNVNEQTKSGELATDKFFILTSSAYEQNSRSVCVDNVWGGVFTRAFVGCAGYDYNSKSWNENMDADENNDGDVTLNECYQYCHSKALEYQDVQVYPLNSSFRLLYK